MLQYSFFFSIFLPIRKSRVKLFHILLPQKKCMKLFFFPVVWAQNAPRAEHTD